MLVTKEIGDDALAKVYVGQLEKGSIEFAESIQPPLSREEKWVLIISCLFGCPVKCLMCDAGQSFNGMMTKEEIFEQTDYMIHRRFPDGRVPVKKFKIQFTRMGEPTFNPAVLDVLEELPNRYDAPGLIPSVSTIGPKSCEDFFGGLKGIKDRLYANGKFQMQFSIHSTDEGKRNELIPVEKMSFEDIAKFGEDFYEPGDRKITLNFIVMDEYPIDPLMLRKYFDPDVFLIKMTPLNPTRNAEKNDLITMLNPNNESSVSQLVKELKSLGYDVIVSIGELEENEIGSNCGMYVSA